VANFAPILQIEACPVCAMCIYLYFLKLLKVIFVSVSVLCLCMS